MSKFFQATLQASKEIMTSLSERKKEHTQKYKIGAGGDISLGADLLSEKIFAQYLLEIANIDSEESGYIKGYGKDKIILDPLDGSDNYLSYIPYYGASLALADEFGTIKEAVIVNFCSQEVFFDIGEGFKECSLLDTTPKSVQINDLIVKCGIFEKAYSNPSLASKLFEQNLKFRSLGASAISLAYAHKTNFMLFSGKIRKYDSEAGLFLCKDLWIKKTDDFLLVSRNKQIFDMIAKIASKE